MTTRFVGPIRRINTARGHHYKDANGHRVPGVTSFLDGGLPKKALIDWAGRATAAYAVDHWDELSALSPSARMKKLEGARYEEKDRAARRGSEVHDLGEKLAAGQEIEVPDELAGHVESFVQFLNDHDPKVILLEATIFSQRYGYAGTLDWILQFRYPLPPFFPQPNPIIMGDTKTTRAGIFGETALQLSGYRFADFYYDYDGVEHPMLKVDGAAALHIRADGYDLIPVKAGPEQHRQLLYVAQVREFDLNSRDLIGNPITPPSRMRRRRLEIVDDIGETS